MQPHKSDIVIQGLPGAQHLAFPKPPDSLIPVQACIFKNIKVTDEAQLVPPIMSLQALVGHVVSAVLQATGGMHLLHS